ncbi:YajG family lipoprotein [Alloalcanivorax mobilis]|uniref:YajG family lipoprotein n=1 Tax=Alloalcanivorax mobilis TaxID=2019569 RepID=UPI000C790A9A|nr:YajG family lipoprotein [Alloalcanivorax mobilis]
MRHLLTITVLALLLGGCALSPQQIEIEPNVTVPTVNRGNNMPVQVIAVDSRSKQAFGSRGGVYKDTALVQPANDIRQAIAESVRKGLQSQGFNAFNPGQDATTLEVRLEQLDYIPEQGSVVNEVTLNLELLAEARRGPTTHTGTYKSSVVHDVPFTPNASRNQTMINDILGKAIQRMLQDPEMLNFLSGNDTP